jgi:hypothetical protein
MCRVCRVCRCCRRVVGSGAHPCDLGRARKREQMFIKIKEECNDVLKYIQAETQARLDSEEYYARMCDEAVTKMQAEVNKECNERELSEQHFFGLLEETTARVRAKM